MSLIDNYTLYALSSILYSEYRISKLGGGALGLLFFQVMDCFKGLDSQQYPLHHHLINNVEDIFVFLALILTGFLAEILNLLMRETAIENNQFSKLKTRIFYLLLID